MSVQMIELEVVQIEVNDDALEIAGGLLQGGGTLVPTMVQGCYY